MTQEESVQSGNVLDDILSMALEQSGFDTLAPIPSSDLSNVQDTLMYGWAPLPSAPRDMYKLDETNNKLAFPEDDLTALLEDVNNDYLQYNLSNVTQPSSHLINTPPPPPHRPSAPSKMEDMDVNDVLLELGLDLSYIEPSGSMLMPTTIPTPSFSVAPITTRGMSTTMATPTITRRLTVPVQATTPTVTATIVTPPPLQGEEDLEEEDDSFSSAETYSTYKPAKLNVGYSHPDPIVESSSLASVEPPQVYYDLKFPENVIEEVRLSSLQLEAVVYACQQHMNILADGSRAGFLIGDGAGVGKGRTVAGIIFQNYIEGRKKAVWLSVSNDLKYDAIRDLHDVGAKKLSVYGLNKFYYGKISGKRNGRVRKGVIFATYSSLIGESSSGGKYRTRFNQLLHWLGPHFDGVIVFDECHKAKNLVPSGTGKPSKTGVTVLQLQKKLPKARIVYCSATGASEPKNMAYMSRLGIWGTGTQFPTFQDFIKSVERRGVGAMELVAMDMKLRGLYIARQLSFSGTKFLIEDVSLSDQFTEMYDKAVEFWVVARDNFKSASALLDYDRKHMKTMWGQFWAAHQRFFKYLCIASKIAKTIEITKEALKNGKCVVIGLQSTGEARTLEQLGQNNGEVDGFVSTAKGVLETLVKRHFPVPSGAINWDAFDTDNTLPQNCRKRKRGGSGVASSNDDSSSGWENSDSAMESSDDEEEMMEEVKDKSDGVGDSDSDSDSEEDDEKKDFFSLFGPDEPSWLERKKPKAKKRKMSLQDSVKVRGSKRGNFSIKPPSTFGSPSKGELKFNYKTLEFEKVTSSKSIDKKPPNNFNDKNKSTNGRDTTSMLNMMNSPSLTSGSQSGRAHVAVHKMKDDLLKQIEQLASSLPTNSLDELIDGLGGPSKVSEMTGRRGRIVTMRDGSVQYQLRTEPDVSIEMLNITEKQRFMDGEKNIAIISEAASSGISLQADRRAKNQKIRIHITLELPWSADKAIQQFGRTHRSNQVSAPEYVFLISTLAGEHRFASIVAKRLESLGALTQGDRRATESRDLSRYNVDTKYGRQALENTLRSIVGTEKPMISSPQYDNDFIQNASVALTNVDLLSIDRIGMKAVDKESLNMTRFLNRLLGLPVKLQNLVFSFFTDTLGEIIKLAKRAGRWDGGILDYGASGENVELMESKEYVGDAAFGTATTQLHKIQVERGMSFNEALLKLNTDNYHGEGFYLSKKARNDKYVSVMLKVSKEGSTSYLVHRPNTGVQARPEDLKALLKKYELSTPEDAERWWDLQYQSTLAGCSHSYWQGKCRLSTTFQPCEVGMRRRTYYVLTGSLLGVWTHLESVFLRFPSQSHKMQIVRVHIAGKKLIGILIPAVCVHDLDSKLQQIALQAAGDS